MKYEFWAKIILLIVMVVIEPLILFLWLIKKIRDFS